MSNSLFEKIDLNINSQLEKIKPTPGYKYLLDFIATIDEESLPLVKAAGTFLFFAIPTFIIFLFYYLNSNLKSELEVKKRIFTLSSNIIDAEKILEVKEREIYSKSVIETEVDFSSKVRNLLKGSDISSSNIQFRNFSSENLDDSTIRSEIELQILNTTSESLTKLISNLTGSGQLKISFFDITRNVQKELITAKLKIVNFGIKVNLDENE